VNAISVFLWLNLFFYGPIFFPIILPLVSYWLGIGWLTVIAYILYAPFFFDWIFPSRYKKEGRVLNSFRFLPILKGVKEYLDMKFVYEEELNGAQYLFGIHPHGHVAFAANAFLNGYAGFLEKWKQLKLRVLGASVTFWTPIMKEIYTWMGTVDASRQTAEYLLEKGYSLTIFPGGIEEQIHTTPKRYDLFMKGRKHGGIVRLSLKYGVPLVPCFAFGPVHFFTPIKAAKPIQHFLYKKFRIGIPFILGRWNLHIPLKGSKLTIIVGKPLNFPRIPDPKDEEIEKYQQEYIHSITKLFNHYKHQYGHPDDILEIH